MVAGGMPQSVAAYVGAADSPLRACEEAKREILRLYEEDIGKYAKGYAAKVRSVFRLIPSALSRHEKEFRLFGKHASLDRFSAKFKSRLGRKYVVCTDDYSEEGGVVYLPVYMAHCL